MQPDDAATLRNECGAGKLKNVAVLLKGSLEADRKSRGFRLSAPAAPLRPGERDAPPGGALEAHGAITLPRGIRNANGRDAVAPTEPRHFFRSSLHYAAYADALRLEFRQGLAQLRERLRIERSAEMAEPEDQRRPVRPQLRKVTRGSGGGCVRKIGDSISYGRRVRHGGLHSAAAINILA